MSGKHFIYGETYLVLLSITNALSDQQTSHRYQVTISRALAPDRASAIHSTPLRIVAHGQIITIKHLHWKLFPFLNYISPITYEILLFGSNAKTKHVDIFPLCILRLTGASGRCDARGGKNKRDEGQERRHGSGKYPSQSVSHEKSPTVSRRSRGMLTIFLHCWLPLVRRFIRHNKLFRLFGQRKNAFASLAYVMRFFSARSWDRAVAKSEERA